MSFCSLLQQQAQLQAADASFIILNQYPLTAPVAFILHCSAACCSSKHNFKLQTLLPYVFDELRGGDTLAVLLLRSILRKMTGVDGVSHLTCHIHSTVMLHLYYCNMLFFLQPVDVAPPQASLLCSNIAD